MTGFRLRGELRLKNARLIENRLALGMSAKQFAAFAGIGYVTYSGYETLRCYPRTPHRTALAALCGCSELELFPPELRRMRGPRGKETRTVVSTAIVSPDRLLGHVRKEVLALPAPEPNEANEANTVALADAIQNVLRYLNEKDQRIMTRYFGLDGEGEHTIAEIAADLGCSRERVRQRRDRVLSRLRGIDYSNVPKTVRLELEDFMQDRSEDPDAAARRQSAWARFDVRAARADAERWMAEVKRRVAHGVGSELDELNVVEAGKLLKRARARENAT